MRFWVGNTDRGWFTFLAGLSDADEVNFWQPNGIRPVTLDVGAPWLFKLKMREGGYIVGGASFAHWTILSPRLAWDVFGMENGAPDFGTFLRALSRNSAHPVDPDLSRIGASVLVEPFFLPRELWIEPPADWASNLTRGKVYDSTEGEGLRLWERVQLARAGLAPVSDHLVSDAPTAAYGAPVLTTPRLGQGAFRVMVTDAYERRCVVTGERTLPVLEAAHIKPYSLAQRHDVSNGLLLRSDLHVLFDRGYLTVNPGDRRLVVSRRIKDEFENGRDYYALHGKELRAPIRSIYVPAMENLEWHAAHVFKG